MLSLPLDMVNIDHVFAGVYKLCVFVYIYIHMGYIRWWD